ncbi:MAG: M1 family metallopeptidase [Bacteroidota bacterium]|nr:M1 family metallopeptidase [Bacteroidota bacterium]
MRKFIVFIIIISSALSCIGQQSFNRKDSLRGELTPIRTCYDVTFYNFSLIIDIDAKVIENSFNEIHFTAISDFDKMQIDLAENLEIIRIEFENDELAFEREFDAVFVYFSRTIKQGEQSKIKVWYKGSPRVAIHPPWDGGFSWEKDKNGKPWIGVSCQGLGASSWWPCKDHQSDEPDSMRIVCAAKYPNKIIANGNLRKDTTIWSDYLNCWLNQSEWFVSYPINNYNVSINVGDYIHFSDFYISGKDSLDLSYYVLSYNEEKARKHFLQVKPMMQCFENYFGRYPFWNDGFSLVETPYLGMEHQSGIAYGNDYLEGYHGNTAFIAGLDFDYIIIHESGHEWWGNSITTNDIADMWVQEGFCTYSEVLYVECLHGYQKMLEYVNNQKRRIRNDKPIIGPFHVNKEGSGDMYQKASLMLHTLRSLIEDDKLWFDILFGLAKNFEYQTIDGQDVIDYINEKSGKDFSTFFNQYLKNKDLPEFQYKLMKEGRSITLLYKWEAIADFDIPILVNAGKDDFWIYPNTDWKEQSLGKIDIDDFSIVEELFLIDVKKIK